MPTLPEGSLNRLTAEQAAVLAQGELHDLRVAMDSVGEAVKCLGEGIWTVDTFIEWWHARKAEHEAALMERFKNALRASR